MFEIFLIVIAIGVALVIIKSIFNSVFSAVSAGFSLTLTVFLGIGFIMFLLAGLSDTVSVSTGWTITLVPTFIAFVYDICKIASNPGQVQRNYHKIKKSRYGFDEDGNEIDFFKGSKCCGNCKHNGGRPPTGGYPNCREDLGRKVNNRYSCSRWRHF